MQEAIVIIDMQNDFVKKDGALYVRNAEETVPVIGLLLKKAREKNIPVFFTMDWHSQNDPEFSKWPRHCVAGSKGAEIIKELAEINAPIVKCAGHDKFFKTGFEKVLRDKGIKKLYIAGIATDYCVKFTVLTALRLGFEVVVVSDAIKAVSAESGQKAIIEMKKAGAKFSESKQVLAGLD